MNPSNIFQESMTEIDPSLSKTEYKKLIEAVQNMKLRYSSSVGTDPTYKTADFGAYYVRKAYSVTYTYRKEGIHFSIPRNTAKIYML